MRDIDGTVRSFEPRQARRPLDRAAEVVRGGRHEQRPDDERVQKHAERDDERQLGEEEASLCRKAGVFLQFYLQQLPPRARQEFLNWPERKEAVRRAVTRPNEASEVQG